AESNHDDHEHELLHRTSSGRGGPGNSNPRCGLASGTDRLLTQQAEVNGRLVGPLVFKTSGTGDPRPVGSIPATSARGTAAPKGGSADRSSTTSASSASPSSRRGSDSESGSAANRSASVTLSSGMSTSTASSDSVAGRPSLSSRRARAFWSRASVSPAWTGRRIVRPVLALPRVMAWRIHQVAYVGNLKPFRQ